MSDQKNDKILEVKNLKVSYHTYAGEVKSVRGVSFDLKEGEAIAIVGESGCGKSVTAKSIMGLIKGPQGEIKQGSEILYHGDNILNYNKKQWQAYKGGEVAIIFQDALASLNPTMRVGKQIMENLMAHKHMTKDEAKKEAVRMLQKVGIPDSVMAISGSFSFRKLTVPFSSRILKKFMKTESAVAITTSCSLSPRRNFISRYMEVEAVASISGIFSCK